MRREQALLANTQHTRLPSFQRRRVNRVNDTEGIPFGTCLINSRCVKRRVSIPHGGGCSQCFGRKNEIPFPGFAPSCSRLNQGDVVVDGGEVQERVPTDVRPGQRYPPNALIRQSHRTEGTEGSGRRYFRQKKDTKQLDSWAADYVRFDYRLDTAENGIPSHCLRCFSRRHQDIAKFWRNVVQRCRFHDGRCNLLVPNLCRSVNQGTCAYRLPGNTNRRRSYA